MKVEKRNNSYRVQKMVGGKRHSITYDHKPTNAEIMRDLIVLEESAPVKGSFLSCAESYIESKEHVLSPKTVRSYKSMLKSSISDDFLRLKLHQITQQDIQIEINKFASNHSPKTTRNIHSFISAVLRQFRPSLNISTTLPQKRKYEPYTPSEDDIRRLLDASSDDRPNHICFQLGCMGLRRSEILALTMDDISGNRLTINKAMVQNKDREWIIKTTKTTSGTRTIYIPDVLADEIREQGYIYNRHPNKMLKALKRYQDRLGIPRFRFHDLRHFFCSYAYEHGFSEQTIMEIGGWQSSETPRKIYRHALNLEADQKQIFDGIIKG